MEWTKEQSDAITLKGCNILVSAGAGSGKTAVLSERVLNKIDDNIHLNELLILTFTNAAAREMKSRIRDKVSNNKDELNRLNSAYITTFDSFALAVVKKYHYLKNISKDISITDESIINLAEEKIIDELFEELYEKEDERFLSLIDKYCLKDDKLLKNNILSLARKVDGMINSSKYLNNIKNNYFKEDNIKNIYKDYLRYLEDRRYKVKIKLNHLDYYFDDEYEEKVKEALNNFLTINIDKLYKIDKISLPRIPNGTLDDAKAYKESIKKEVDSILKLNKYGSYEEVKKDILSNQDNTLTIVDLIIKYSDRLSKYKKDNNLYTFNDIAKLAISILEENESARNELKYTFKEIMIDEYQDTNDIQDAFIKLIANNNVYMVGDIKQSIYGFRGSNPYIFKEKYDNYSKNNNGIKIDLIKNFRSRKEVLDNVNEIFSLIMDDEIGGASYKVSHMMNYGNALYDDEKEDIDYNVNILEYDNSDKEFSDEEIEIFTIAKDILKNVGKTKVFDKKNNKLRISNYSDYVIILDRSKYFNTFKKVFEYLGIPLTVLKDDELTSNYDILIIKNLIELVIKINHEEFDKTFNYDMASILRSFLYEKSDQEIFDIVTHSSYQDTDVYKDLVSISDISSKSIPNLLEDLLNVTDFYNKIVKVGDYNSINARIEYLYDMATSLNDIGYSIEDFNSYLEELISNNKTISYRAYTPNTDSVKIMTIHGSKGLEFPFCYFADLDHYFNTMELKDKFVVSNKYGIIIPSNLEHENTSVPKLLYKDLYLKEEVSEKERLLYVALTRAREKIIIVIPKKSGDKLELDDYGLILNAERSSFNKLADYIYAIKEYLPKYFSNLDIRGLNITKEYLYPKTIDALEINNTNFLEVQELSSNYNYLEEKQYSKEGIALITSEDQEKMNFGTKVHEILEYLDFKNPDLSNIDHYFQKKISKLLENPLFYKVKEATIYKEYEFVYEENNENNHGVIDLMLEYPDHIDIVDYKLKNIDDEGYLKQLQGYNEYISSISNKKVNIYLYSIIDEFLRKLD